LASRLGLADLLLEAVPILINVALACWFGRSLLGGEPLVARFVVAIEGAERLLGQADLLLEAVPILINVALACWFGRSLLGGEPLVARFVVAIEGAERLREP